MKAVVPPWKRPGRLLWLLLALAGSCWLTLHMPEPRMSRDRAVAFESVDGWRKMESGRAWQKDWEGDSSESAVSGGSGSPELTRLADRAKTFGRLFSLVGLAAFAGGLFEARRWYRRLSQSMERLTRLARLPEIVGLAMPASLCSNAAANSLLVSSHAEGIIKTSALLAGGMINSYFAYVSHSIRIMYPVIGAVGLSGALYFTVQFSGGLLVLIGLVLWNRWRTDEREYAMMSMYSGREEGAPLPWTQAVGKAAERAFTLLFKMLCITVPLMLGMEWLLKDGIFGFWERSVPEQIHRFFPAELLSVVAAQMGGLVQSSAVAANLRAEGLINDTQILLAMLAGSAVGNPFRTLRRNLPSALAIFSVPQALTIVGVMQFSRLVVTLCAIAGVVAWMHV